MDGTPWGMLCALRPYFQGRESVGAADMVIVDCGEASFQSRFTPKHARHAPRPMLPGCARPDIDMKTHPLRLAAAVASLLAACAFLAQPAFADAAVSVDFNAAHNFSGIGVQMAMKNARPREEAQLLHDMNAQFVRISLIPNIKEEIPTGQSVEAYAQILQGMIPQKLQANIQEFRGTIEPLHIKPHLVFWHMPAAWEETVQ